MKSWFKDICTSTVTRKWKLFLYNILYSSTVFQSLLLFSSYQLFEFTSEKVYVVNLNISVCLESGQPCTYQQSVLKEATISMPLCTQNDGFLIKGNTPIFKPYLSSVEIWFPTNNLSCVWRIVIKFWYNICNHKRKAGIDFGGCSPYCLSKRGQKREKNGNFYTPPTKVAGYIVFRSVRSSVCPSVRHTYVNFDFSGTASHIVMKFCTLAHYIKDNTLRPKMGFLGNVCLSEKLRFTFLSTFL